MIELMQQAKAYFNFHPEEEFTSLIQLLEVAGKAHKYDKYYHHACSRLAIDMALYIDKQNINTVVEEE